MFLFKCNVKILAIRSIFAEAPHADSHCPSPNIGFPELSIHIEEESPNIFPSPLLLNAEHSTHFCSELSHLPFEEEIMPLAMAFLTVQVSPFHEGALIAQLLSLHTFVVELVKPPISCSPQLLHDCPSQQNGLASLFPSKHDDIPPPSLPAKFILILTNLKILLL